MSKVEELINAFQRSTQGDWIVRLMRPNDAEGAFFVQAPRIDPKHPYDIDVLGEDDTLYPTKRGDAEFIVLSHNLMPTLTKLLLAAEKLHSLNNDMVCQPNAKVQSCIDEIIQIVHEELR